LLVSSCSAAPTGEPEIFAQPPPLTTLLATAPSACPALDLTWASPPIPQVAAPRAFHRVYGHAEAGRSASRRRPTSLSTPELGRESENTHDSCGLERPRFGLDYIVVPGGARGAWTAPRNDGWPVGIPGRCGAASRRLSEVRKCAGARAACPRPLPQAHPPHSGHRRGPWRSPRRRFPPPAARNALSHPPLGPRHRSRIGAVIGGWARQAGARRVAARAGGAAVTLAMRQHRKRAVCASLGAREVC
jgi:hypothetical protein